MELRPDREGSEVERTPPEKFASSATTGEYRRPEATPAERGSGSGDGASSQADDEEEAERQLRSTTGPKGDERRAGGLLDADREDSADATLRATTAPPPMLLKTSRASVTLAAILFSR